MANSLQKVIDVEPEPEPLDELVRKEVVRRLEPLLPYMERIEQRMAQLEDENYKLRRALASVERRALDAPRRPFSGERSMNRIMEEIARKT